QGGRDPRDPEGRGDQHLPAGKVRRSLHGSPSPLDGQARSRLQGHEGGGRLLARRRQEPAAPARLRHGISGSETARRLSASARGGGEARPSPAWSRARPVPSAGGGGRQRLLASQ